MRDQQEKRFPELESVLPRAVEPRKLSACIVTPDIAGPARNGGIGTAYHHLARQLVAEGHAVTVLYVSGGQVEGGRIEAWIEAYRAEGIELLQLPEPQVPGPRGAVNETCRIAYATYEWLKGREFDVVHVTEWRGAAYYCLVAKRLGIAFHNTLFCVKASSPLLWTLMGNSQPLSELGQLVTAHLEKRSIELADVVVSGSRHLLHWMEQHGYELPDERTFFQPNVMPPPAKPLERDHRAVKEFVFFGRLEPRKGLHIFCDAVSGMARRLASSTDLSATDVKVTFLGKEAGNGFPSRQFIEGQARSWPFEWKIVDSIGQAEAVDYLRGPGLCAVMPSVVDNSPFGVYECLANSIPFLAASAGGIPELVHPDDQPAVLFPPHPRQLERRLLDVLAHGVAPARSSFDFGGNLETWRRFHHAVPGLRQTLRPDNEGQAPDGEAPLVSVCLAHYNRPRLLQQALASIEAQDYPHFEVVLVDDGSTEPEAIAELDRLEPVFRERGWRIVRQENSYLGAARNAGARHSRGQYLLFMDDDNVARPHELTTLVNAALHSGADILTCFADEFAGDRPPSEKTRVERRLTPVGDNLALGLFVNGFGDSNCLVRRSAFEELGGFTEDYKVGKDDQEFFARAVLRGYRLLPVPEALFWYRQSAVRLRDRHYNQFAGDLRVARTYTSALPPRFESLLLLAQGLRHSSPERSAGLGRMPHNVRQNLERTVGQLERHPRLFDLTRRFFHLQNRAFELLLRAEIAVGRAVLGILKRIRGAR